MIANPLACIIMSKRASLLPPSSFYETFRRQQDISIFRKEGGPLRNSSLMAVGIGCYGSKALDDMAKGKDEIYSAIFRRERVSYE